jgi:hypothetical protein
MNILTLLISNLASIPILSFGIGILLSNSKSTFFYHEKIKTFLTISLLFFIGLKGGSSLINHFSPSGFFTLFLLLVWGFTQPLLSYGILRRFIKIDTNTAIAISACFGSVSVMTYIAGGDFLEKLGIQYDSVATTALALMEIPAIISGVFIAKKVSEDKIISTKKIIFETIFNKTIAIIFAGMTFGIICSLFNWNDFPKIILIGFKPFLSVFLLYMGWTIGKKKKDLGQFSWSLMLFGFYMPLLGGIFGILLSFFLKLDIGTGTMVAILSASASYIAAPAAMKIAVPQANDTVYLPLSLGIAFPFNVVIGIPLYYQLSLLILKN